MTFPNTPGSELHPEDQRYVLSAFVNRYTGQHIPAWARKPRPDGTRYPLAFADDADWLANTQFATRKDGRLDRRNTSCYSRPTWPNNPELHERN